MITLSSFRCIYKGKQVADQIFNLQKTDGEIKFQRVSNEHKTFVELCCEYHRKSFNFFQLLRLSVFKLYLQVFDYIALTGSMKDRMIEYVDHLHEHFIHPPRMGPSK